MRPGLNFVDAGIYTVEQCGVLQRMRFFKADSRTGFVGGQRLILMNLVVEFDDSGREWNEVAG